MLESQYPFLIVAYRVYAFVQMKEILTDHFEQL